MGKKKEQCPYCGKWFVYLSRHKCKVKERMESQEEEKSTSERRMERIEERRKELTRNLTKQEKQVLDVIDKEEEIFFNDLVSRFDIERNKLDEIVDILALQSRIKVRRELVDASWSKHIFAIKEIDEEREGIKVQEKKVDKSRPDWIWDIFNRQPCFICPFTEQCADDNPDVYNPHYCPWLSDWIKISLEGEEYTVDFEEYQEELYEEQ
ncbi:MAG: hypothetical protein BAJALOKI3v1_60054 [Promethearchaeota archaeon]|jgi:uncharacterized Zn finger protein (UPF0148 family)|nr:MAG: hypothetical protein BAJALOKI3v1_60054 [Candidatus Lokiarchaeota archaeon]